jgi:hypothetical protein
VRRAAREFARTELSGHKYVGSPHHTANPTCTSAYVRSQTAESAQPRKATCIAGAKRSPRSFGGTASMRKQAVRPREVPPKTTTRFGAPKPELRDLSGVCVPG